MANVSFFNWKKLKNANGKVKNLHSNAAGAIKISLTKVKMTA